MRGAVAACLLLSLVNAAPVARSQHDELDFQARLEACSRSSGRHVLLTHYDGRASAAVTTPITGEKCAQLLEADWLYRLFRKP